MSTGRKSQLAGSGIAARGGGGGGGGKRECWRSDGESLTILFDDCRESLRIFDSFADDELNLDYGE